ncbi:MAG: rRNA (cytosine967-C5)-methyltransferase, partial [Microbacteriaceae bacterium]|nr:rRNA (cytosine967-C5)-methyltransferase [Microbacteriaceae bacterium]
YVTCSPHLGETRGIVTAALESAAAKSVSRMDTAAVLASVTLAPLDLGESTGHVQLWPQRHGTDAMFICLLRKSE